MTDIEQRALIERLRQRTSNSHPAPKPDPLAEMLEKDFGGYMPDAEDFRAALKARGLEIREKSK